MKPSIPYKDRAKVRARFLARVKLESGCMIWKGHTIVFKGEPRPVMRINGVRYHANRVSAWLWLGLDITSLTDQANHGPCNNTLCVHPKHLYVGTQGQNISDSYVRGNHNNQLKGESIGTSKLTESQVRSMVTLRNQGLTLRELELTFDVCRPEISRICSGKRWAHLGLPPTKPMPFGRPRMKVGDA